MMLAAQRTMAEAQGATPPAWRSRSRLALLVDVLDGWRRPRLAWRRLRQLVGFVLALLRPRLVRSRLERLRGLGHIDAVPTTAQLLVAARDQMMLGASEETKIFYRSQGIPWIFHNLRRVLSGPATMLDPAGLFSPRDTLIGHVLQTFHRHPVYDLVLLRGFSDGLDQMETQARQIVAGTHPEQRALASLIEDGSYHQRLVDEVRSFRADPFIAARPIPPGLVADSLLMLAMDQFKDLRGFTSYAARLRAGMPAALIAWLEVAWNETLGGLLKIRIGPSAINVDACDPAVLARHLAPDVR
jgi:hypothetical protein